MVNRGEVWWVEHPEHGRRPHLVLTRAVAIPLLRNITCVPATSTVRGIGSEVLLDPDDGMPHECVLTFDNITQVPRSLLRERICTLGPERMGEVCRSLRYATGC